MQVQTARPKAIKMKVNFKRETPLHYTQNKDITGTDLPLKESKPGTRTEPIRKHWSTYKCAQQHGE